MRIRQQLYYSLVDSIPPIKQQYLDYLHAVPRNKAQKYAYLAYLHGRRLWHGGRSDGENLPLTGSESARLKYPPPRELADSLGAFAIVSFDVFDTLLLRPFGRPADLFYLVGEKLKYLNYAQLRESMETKARREFQRLHGTPEVTLAEFCEYLHVHCGVDKELALETELAVERDLLAANPYMLEVFQRLKQKDKRLIAVTDTYFPREFLEEVLERNGYSGFEELFVSCEYRRGKWDGKLFDTVLERLGRQEKIVHLGDNPVSDQKIPMQKGISIKPYQNVNVLGNKHRPVNQSALTKAAYRGIVNSHLYNGVKEYTPFYEYGFSIGGLFVLGYCNFIKEYVDRKGIDKVLFLSRDGDVLKKAYDLLFPDRDTNYVYWSRSVATKLGAEYFQYDYLRRFIAHKTGKGEALSRTLEAMDLLPLAEELLKSAGLAAQEKLTDKTADALQTSILRHWDKILRHYELQHAAAKQYFCQVLDGTQSAVTVDIGWAGSGGVILSWLVEEKWKLPCRITGLVAGTNTPYTDEPDASEAFLQSGRMEAYLFSQSHNRDLWKTHVPQKKHNLYMELLLSSPTPGFLGFQPAGEGAESGFLFASCREKEMEAAKEIQKGILNFVRQYSNAFKKYPYMMRISGSDAYAPFAAALRSKKYLASLTKELVFEEDVMGTERDKK